MNWVIIGSGKGLSSTKNLAIIAPPPAVASEIVHQDALAYSEFSQGVG